MWCQHIDLSTNYFIMPIRHNHIMNIILTKPLNRDVIHCINYHTCHLEACCRRFVNWSRFHNHEQTLDGCTPSPFLHALMTGVSPLCDLPNYLRLASNRQFSHQTSVSAHFSAIFFRSQKSLSHFQNYFWDQVRQHHRQTVSVCARVIWLKRHE